MECLPWQRSFVFGKRINGEKRANKKIRSPGRARCVDSPVVASPLLCPALPAQHNGSGGNKSVFFNRAGAARAPEKLAEQETEAEVLPFFFTQRYRFGREENALSPTKLEVQISVLPVKRRRMHPSSFNGKTIWAAPPSAKRKPAAIALPKRSSCAKATRKQLMSLALV